MNTEDALSPRELEIAQLAAGGLSCPAIAARLFITANTVKTHLRHLYAKLGIHNRSQLTRVLLQARKITRTGDRQ